MIRFTLTIAIAFLAGCDDRSGATDAKRPAAGEIPAPRELPRETILRNMPANREQRCVGISVVTEALLDGRPVDGDGGETAEDIARRVYHSLVTRQQLIYYPQVIIDEESVSIESPAAINELSSLVTDFYKQDYRRLSKTEQGRQQLLAAEDSFVATEKELDRILDAEPDETEAFFGSGSRTFPDDTLESTHHVFLIDKRDDGTKYVYDSNDPGSPITCQLANRLDGVEVEWTCQYRDTGKETTQRYLVVDKDTFFRLILGE